MVGKVINKILSVLGDGCNTPYVVVIATVPTVLIFLIVFAVIFMCLKTNRNPSQRKSFEAFTQNEDAEETKAGFVSMQ